MYGAMIPPVRTVSATALQAIGEITLCKATLALENTPSKQPVTTRARIRHLSIFSRILLQAPMKPIPVLCLLELARWAKLVQESQLGVVWLVTEEGCMRRTLPVFLLCLLPSLLDASQEPPPPTLPAATSPVPAIQTQPSRHPGPKTAVAFEAGEAMGLAKTAGSKCSES